MVLVSFTNWIKRGSCSELVTSATTLLWPHCAIGQLPAQLQNWNAPWILTLQHESDLASQSCTFGLRYSSPPRMMISFAFKEITKCEYNLGNAVKFDPGITFHCFETQRFGTASMESFSTELNFYNYCPPHRTHRCMLRVGSCCGYILFRSSTAPLAIGFCRRHTFDIWLALYN